MPALGTSTTGLGLAIRNANNGQAIQDPLTATDTSCFANDDATSTASDCIYYYQTCDSSTTYRLIARFESASNKALYNVDADTTGATCDPT